ncbi:MAG: tetratricopeptide repeat protein [Methanobacteriaceae archaeon]|nr:tetratricopeptide repeat protein [Methanobacteriaceae archaeon]MDP3035760.1 tetratricopeptide repeat protein [Methanobacteriaceae archaeon]MDP3484057.1 tetratricopeptide repeat protein [Methanobacteriaceae archaeon]MDP3622810.1 tetratricopeptide repeat protein [Methanobacteriaceae archaeon]
MFPSDQRKAKIWINKGKAHQNLSQFSEALESFNQALILDPDLEEAKELKIEASKNI